MDKELRYNRNRYVFVMGVYENINVWEQLVSVLHNEGVILESVQRCGV